MSLLVLALGNDLLGDDGVGLLAADHLKKVRLQNTKVVKSGLSGLYLVDLIEGFDDLVIVDSLVGETPGEVKRLPLNQMGPKIVPSAHYLGLPEALDLAKRAGMDMPERVEVVAMLIRDSQVLGTGVSAEVLRGLPALVEEVIKVAAEWGYSAGGEPANRGPAKRSKGKKKR